MVENKDRGMIEEVITCLTTSPEQTRELGRRIGKLLEPGDAVCLFGELGSGKTCLAGGLARGMGVQRETVTSPSYVMINRYQGRFPVYHIDLYRLDSPADTEEIGLTECMSEDCVAVIEWASRIEDVLPDERMDISIYHVSPEEREIRFVLRGGSNRGRAGEIIRIVSSI